jgi:hypothetical protein
VSLRNNVLGALTRVKSDNLSNDQLGWHLAVILDETVSANFCKWAERTKVIILKITILNQILLRESTLQLYL